MDLCKVSQCEAHVCLILRQLQAVTHIFMADGNVAGRDLGKVLFEHAVVCLGKFQLERAIRFPMPQLEHATRFCLC